MDRNKRIRVVAVAGVALFAIFVAFIGAPLIAAAFLPSPDFSNDSDAFKDPFTQAVQTARVVNTVSMVALLVAGGCFLYLLILLAVWFIGAKDSTADPGS